MGYGGYGDYAPYVPVAQRLANGRRKLEQLAKKRGRPVAPVTIERKHRHIASSFWGKAWCDHLESHSDYASRLPRGRTYVRNGSVLDLYIGKGKIEAYVAGSELYRVTIDLNQLTPPRWKKIIASCAGRIGSLIGLLRGELSSEVLAIVTHPQSGLFPAPSEIKLRCSCPDAAFMCKHIAAVLYGVGARLDQAPELFFVLRQVDQAELVAGADVAGALVNAGASATGRRRIASTAVASVFGIELDDAPPPLAAKSTRKKPGSAASEAQSASKKSRSKKKSRGKKAGSKADAAVPSRNSRRK